MDFFKIQEAIQAILQTRSWVQTQLLCLPSTKREATASYEDSNMA